MTEACGENPQLEALTPQRLGRKALGPLLTDAFAGALLWLRPFGITVPNPILFFANVIVLSAFLGGVGAGLASVSIALVFALIYWSVPGQFLHFAPIDCERLIVLALTVPPLGLLVGWLRSAYDRKQRELVDQNIRLANELQLRITLEERQRDVDHILQHDLRTPLNGIINIPQLLIDDNNLTTQQREMLAMVAAGGRKMLHQINNSLELRKIEDYSYTLQVQPCDPAQTLQDTCKTLTTIYLSKKPIFHLTAHTSVVLKTDYRLLDVIFTNLLTNALEASDEGSPVLVDLNVENNECVVTIANNRPVPEEIRLNFFDKYVTAGKVGGTGLGTYSASLMTAALGGSLAMETSDQEGTKVTVRIPLDNGLASCGGSALSPNQ